MALCALQDIQGYVERPCLMNKATSIGMVYANPVTELSCGDIHGLWQPVPAIAWKEMSHLLISNQGLSVPKE